MVLYEVCIFHFKAAWFGSSLLLSFWHVFNSSCWRQRPPGDHFMSIQPCWVFTSLHCWLNSALFALTAASCVCVTKNYLIEFKLIYWLSSLLFFSPFFSSQPREKGRMRFHRLQNVQIALDFLKQRQVCTQTDRNNMNIQNIHNNTTCFSVQNSISSWSIWWVYCNPCCIL